MLCRHRSRNGGLLTDRRIGPVSSRAQCTMQKPYQQQPHVYTIHQPYQPARQCLPVHAAVRACVQQPKMQKMNTTVDDDDHQANKEDNTYGLSDDEFQNWFAERLASHPLMEDYPRIQLLASRAVTQWRQRFRGNIQLWRKLFKGERVVKEIIEGAPVLDATINIVENLPEGNEEKFTLIDLASGRGYISMILSEVLPPHKVEKIYLIDKAWPLSGTVDALPHQISWEHLYGNRPEEQGGGCYFKTWPIPLHTSKQDLKQRCTRRQLRRAIFDKCQGPVLILAVHLCGTLSLRAVEMFNDYPEKVKYLALNPAAYHQSSMSRRSKYFPSEATPLVPKMYAALAASRIMFGTGHLDPNSAKNFTFGVNTCFVASIYSMPLMINRRRRWTWWNPIRLTKKISNAWCALWMRQVSVEKNFSKMNWVQRPSCGSASSSILAIRTRTSLPIECH